MERKLTYEIVSMHGRIQCQDVVISYLNGDKTSAVESIKSMKYDLNVDDGRENTLMTLACEMGDDDILTLLLEHGAEIETGAECSPVEAAILFGSLSCLQILFKTGCEKYKYKHNLRRRNYVRTAYFRAQYEILEFFVHNGIISNESKYLFKNSRFMGDASAFEKCATLLLRAGISAGFSYRENMWFGRSFNDLFIRHDLLQRSMMRFLKIFNRIRLAFSESLPFHIMEEIAVAEWCCVRDELDFKNEHIEILSDLGDLERTRICVSALSRNKNRQGSRRFDACQSDHDILQLLSAMKYFPYKIDIIHAEIKQRNSKE